VDGGVHVIVIAAILSCLPVAATVVWAARRSASPPEFLNPDWLDDLSMPDRYRPLLRLLDRGDFDFLRSQPGCTPRMLARFRRQRFRVACAYLRALRTDFDRVSLALKLLLLNSPVDRPELTRALVRSRILFASAMMMMRIRLLFFRLGIGGVDASGIVKRFEHIRFELVTFAASTVAAGK
jgi:hypothetical protein